MVGRGRSASQVFGGESGSEADERGVAIGRETETLGCGVSRPLSRTNRSIAGETLDGGIDRPDSDEDPVEGSSPGAGKLAAGTASDCAWMGVTPASLLSNASVNPIMSPLEK